MEFEWAPAKAAANLRKHQVSFDEAVTVFADSFSVTASDPDHSGKKCDTLPSDDPFEDG